MQAYGKVTDSARVLAPYQVMEGGQAADVSGPLTKYVPTWDGECSLRILKMNGDGWRQSCKKMLPRGCKNPSAAYAFFIIVVPLQHSAVGG